MKKRTDDTELLIQREHGSDGDYDEESMERREKKLAPFNQWPHVFNLANCIVGVSVLAMPYCFQQCGILLAVLMIGFCSVLAKLTCHFLSSGANIVRRRSYEALALVALGQMGRRIVELMLLLFLMSSIVAFMVMIGDIGPHVVADYLELEAPTQRLRILVMVLVLLFVIFPLSAIKELDNFSVVSSAAVFFYGIFVVHLFLNSLPVIWEGTWSIHVVWWRPQGFLACLPIISMALSCQTQLFCVVESIKDATSARVDTVINSSINICSSMYAAVGLFGYVAFYNKELHGDVLVNLEPTLFTQLLKLCFMLSIAVSIPLMLFPARIALFNLCLRQGGSELPVSNIQHSTFHVLTFVILLVNLGIAIVVPNVEFILGLTGSLIGSLVAIIVPSIMFLAVTQDKGHHSVPYARFCLVIGVTILCASTWATLQADRRSHVAEKPLPKTPDGDALKSLERLEEKVLDANINISHKLDEVAGLAKAGKDKEAEKLLIEMKEQQKEQEKLIKKQEEIVEELNKHVELHHADDDKEKKEMNSEERVAEKEREVRHAVLEGKREKLAAELNDSKKAATGSVKVVEESKQQQQPQQHQQQEAVKEEESKKVEVAAESVDANNNSRKSVTVYPVIRNKKDAVDPPVAPVEGVKKEAEVNVESRVDV